MTVVLSVQAVRPELADRDEHEDQTGLESLMEGDQKHHTYLPGATTDDSNAVHVHVVLVLYDVVKQVVLKDRGHAHTLLANVILPGMQYVHNWGEP